MYDFFNRLAVPEKLHVLGLVNDRSSFSPLAISLSFLKLSISLWRARPYSFLLLNAKSSPVAWPGVPHRKGFREEAVVDDAPVVAVFDLEAIRAVL